MCRFFATIHPTEDFDIIIGYDAMSLRIEYVRDDNKEDIQLNEIDMKHIQQEVVEHDMELQREAHGSHF